MTSGDYPNDNSDANSDPAYDNDMEPNPESEDNVSDYDPDPDYCNVVMSSSV